MTFGYTATSGSQGESDDGALYPWPWSLESNYTIQRGDTIWKASLASKLEEFTKNNQNINLVVSESEELINTESVKYSFNLKWVINKNDYLSSMKMLLKN